MRSNSLDFSSFEAMPKLTVPKKTERSHEENQERAYIAASRRTDRSADARVQSARMASAIHKRRTGKSFHITEEIVMNEEMYEEEDDDLPRSYRILGPNMQTSSAHMNSRVEAYLSNKINMSTLLARTDDAWRNNEVNKRFAELFPQHARQSSDTPPVSPLQPEQVPQHQPQQVPQHQQLQLPPLQPQELPPHQQQQQLPQHQQQQLPQHQQQQLPPIQPPQHHHQQPQHSPFPQRPLPVPEQFHSMPSHSDPFPPTQQLYAHQSAQHARAFSTSALSQYSPQHPEFLRPDFGGALPGSPSTFNPSPHPDSPMELGSSRSAFTAELPSEARMMMMGGVDMNAGYETVSQTWPTMDSSFDMSGVPRDSRGEEEQVISPTSEVISPTTDAFDMSNLKWDPMMPPIDESTWNTFMNDNAWNDGQP